MKSRKITRVSNREIRFVIFGFVIGFFLALIAAWYILNIELCYGFIAI
ncbi:MAG: hypothetical protein ABIG10_02595 [bacterium]